MRDFRRAFLLTLTVGVLLVEGFAFGGRARAESRGVLEWRHDANELFVTSHARRPLTFRCRWELERGWVGHAWGPLNPGATAVSWTHPEFGRPHAFDCWRTDR